MKEPESTNIRSPKRLEVKEREKPFLDNRDMCGLMCIVCAALITYQLITSGQVVYGSRLQLYGAIISLMFLISVSLFCATQKIVRICYFRAKRKATDKVGDQSKNKPIK